MSEKLTDYIFATDFKRFGYKIIFKNETSQTFFLKHEEIQIKELKDKGINIEIPNNLCQKGHTLTLYLFDLDHTLNLKAPNFSSTLKEAKYEIISKVEALDLLTAQDNTCNLELTFLQYDVKAWNKIIETHQDKQDQINELIAKQFKSPKDE